jgi:hypothetical protein
MEIGVTSDSPGWSKVSEISKELRGLSEIFEGKYGTLNLKIIVCLRCLADDIERKSFCRFSTKDRTLVMDICMNESAFVIFKESKEEQRKIIGTSFFDFFESSIRKNRKKLPELDIPSETLITDVRDWCMKNKWISV